MASLDLQYLVLMFKHYLENQLGQKFLLLKEDCCLLIGCYQVTKSPQTVLNEFNCQSRVLPQSTLHDLVNSSVEVALHNCVDNGMVFGVQN